MKGKEVASGLAVLLSASIAWADGDHGAHAPKMLAPWWVWGVGLAVLTLVLFFLFYQAKRGTLLSGRFSGFSRNARLLLIRSPFSGLSVSRSEERRVGKEC